MKIHKSVALLITLAVLLCGCTQPEENQPIAEGTSAEQTTAAQTTVLPDYSGSPEFTGISFDGEAMPCPSINNKYGKLQMFCCHEEMVYFANPQDGRRLYSFDGKETKCLTEIPAISLYYRDGEIYFLSARTDYNYRNTIDVKGRLYKYRVESGETIRLSDTIMTGLWVDDQGIYYSLTEVGDEGSRTNHLYEYDEISGSSEKLYDDSNVMALFQRFGDIELLRYYDDKTSEDVVYLKKGEEVFRLFSGVIPYRYCIWNGKFYYADQLKGFELSSIDLTNGEREEFGFAHDYTFVNGEFYYLSGGKLYKREAEGDAEIGWPNGGIPTEYFDNGRAWSIGSNYLALYTTGTELYALIEWYPEGGGTFDGIVRVSVAEDGYPLVELLA